MFLKVNNIANMKKYRYGELGTTKLFKWRHLIYFGLAWNAFGYCLYTYLTKDKDEEWQKLKSSQKYLSMIASPASKISVISVSGSGITSLDTNVEDYLVPERPALPPQSTDA